MANAPRQDWTAYRKRVKQCDAAWLRALSTDERFALYADLFDMIWEARGNRGMGERLESWSWNQKVASRLRQVRAFAKLDELHRERAASHHSG
jgi:hypothetical protein